MSTFRHKTIIVFQNYERFLILKHLKSFLLSINACYNQSRNCFYVHLCNLETQIFAYITSQLPATYISVQLLKFCTPQNMIMHNTLLSLYTQFRPIFPACGKTESMTLLIDYCQILKCLVYRYYLLLLYCLVIIKC